LCGGGECVHDVANFGPGRLVGDELSVFGFAQRCIEEGINLGFHLLGFGLGVVGACPVQEFAGLVVQRLAARSDVVPQDELARGG
jgi:hypothetical protein